MQSGEQFRRNGGVVAAQPRCYCAQRVTVEELESAVDVNCLESQQRLTDLMPGLARHPALPSIGAVGTVSEHHLRLRALRGREEDVEITRVELPVGIAERDPFVAGGERGLKA